MQSIVEKIVNMLGDERIERRCAAAMVLGELRVQDAGVVDALGRALADESAGPLRLYALEALAPLRSKKIAGFVAPLLDSADAELRQRASALLAAQGGKASKSLLKELDEAPATRRHELVKLLAANHDEATFERLITLLADVEIADSTLQVLRGEIEHMQPKEVALLQKSLLARLKDRPWMKDALAAARTVRLLGYMRDGKLVPTLLPYTAVKHPLPLRLAALAALRRPLAKARATAKLKATLLQLGADETPQVCRAATEALRQVELDATHTKSLLALADSPDSETRRFALSVLGRLGGKEVTALMVARLGADDVATRETASRALRQMHNVAGELLGQLAASLDDGEAAQRLTRLLMPHLAELKPAQRKKITALATEALESESPARPSLSKLVKAVDAEGYAAAITERALKHKRAKRCKQAFALLGQLDATGMIDEAGRYAALVCGLNATDAKKDLARASRTTHPVLKHAVELLRLGVDVGKKLRRERSLAIEDLFYLGFNFAESRDDDEQGLGEALLSHLVEKSPRSKLGKSAKNKLKLLGLWE